MFFPPSCGSNRRLTVRKSDGEQTSSISSMHLARTTCQQIEQLLQRFPLTNKERQDLLPKVERTQGGSHETSRLNYYTGIFTCSLLRSSLTNDLVSNEPLSLMNLSL